MLYRTLIAFTTVVALGCLPVTTSASAAGRDGHGGGHAAGRTAGGHATAGRAMAGRGYAGGGRRYVGGRRGVGYGYGGGYGNSYGYGGDYGCNGYYDNYNGCGYNPGAAIVGGLIGGAMTGFGAY